MSSSNCVSPLNLTLMVAESEVDGAAMAGMCCSADVGARPRELRPAVRIRRSEQPDARVGAEIPSGFGYQTFTNHEHK